MFTYFPKRSAAQFLLERRLESNISWRRKVRCSVSVSDPLSFFLFLIGLFLEGGMEMGEYR
jgi:hypothetical protein